MGADVGSVGLWNIRQHVDSSPWTMKWLRSARLVLWSYMEQQKNLVLLHIFFTYHNWHLFTCSNVSQRDWTETSTFFSFFSWEKVPCHLREISTLFSYQNLQRCKWANSEHLFIYNINNNNNTNNNSNKGYYCRGFTFIYTEMLTEIFEWRHIYCVLSTIFWFNKMTGKHAFKLCCRCKLLLPRCVACRYPGKVYYV